MKKTALIYISVPEDAEDPLTLVIESIERFAGQTYRVLDSRYIGDSMPPGMLESAIVISGEKSQ